jgi:hypothetical protein
MTRVLEVSLAAGKMTPELIVETLGVEELAANAPRDVWVSLAKAGEAIAAVHAPAPTLEVLDEEVSSVLVELEDSGVMKPMQVMEPPPKELAPPAKIPPRDRPKA